MMRQLCTSLALWLRRKPRLGRWALRMLPDFPLNIQIPPIGSFRIRVRQNRSFWLRDPLILEQFPLGALAALIHGGETVYDVGANIGLYTRLLLNFFHAKHVVAFEPMTQTRSLLIQNVALGNIADKVTLLPYALSNMDGQQLLQVDDFSSASSTLDTVTSGSAAPGRQQYGLSPKTEQVMCRRLDSLLGELALPTPDIIKVDIEGAEGLFLEGAQSVLRQHSPKLLIELHGAQYARQAFAILHELGYHCSGCVSQVLREDGYTPLDAALVEQARGLYDIHYLLAARNADDLPKTITPFHLKT